MGFFRNQQIHFARRLLEGQYDRRGVPRPPDAELDRQAAEVVDEARRIARQRGRNVLGILKEMVLNLKR